MNRMGSATKIVGYLFLATLILTVCSSQKGGKSLLLHSSSEKQIRFVRMLQEGDDSNEEQNKKQESTKTKKQTSIHLIMVLVALGVLVAGGCILSIVCLIRKVMGGDNYRRGNGFSAGKVVNNTFQFDHYFPSIPFKLFRKQIGEPLQDSCVICLQQFQFTPQTLTPNKMREISQETVHFELSSTGKKLPEDIFPNQTEIMKKEKVLVKFTVCGHLLHGKCLNDWLSREENCPLCREPLTEENMQIWEDKLNIDFEAQLKKAQNAKKKEYRLKKLNTKEKPNLVEIELARSNHESTLGELGRPKQTVTPVEECSELSRKVQMSEDGMDEKQLYAIHMYSVIMKYHRRKKQLEDRIFPVEEQNEEVEVVFEGKNKGRKDTENSKSSMRSFHEEFNQIEGHLSNEVEVRQKMTEPIKAQLSKFNRNKLSSSLRIPRQGEQNQN